MDLKQFIVRPVLSSVISVMIVVVGIISLVNLPVEQFPNIAPPTIQVSAAYFGANAETVQNSVIAPLEEAINGVEDMTYMTSAATNTGTATISVYFKQGTNPDMASVNVQNRVSRSLGELPAEVTQVGVTTSKRQSSMLQVISLYSSSDDYDSNFLSNYIDINLRPQILRISGVGDLQVFGSKYSMRVWLQPDIMAQYGLIPSDVTSALAQQNIEAATGAFGENSTQPFQYTMKYKGRLMTPEEFGEVVIRATQDGEVLKLKDVARIEFGADSYAFTSQTNGKPGATCVVYQVAGSNATSINLQIDELMEEVKKGLPEGIEIVQIMSSNDFLFASIHEVIKTLFEAILLVILVVFVFLQDLRSTLIPLISIFVSLIGTFAFMMIIGFSLNLITLFSLILVIGVVVDDAIIVVEAVQARFEAGYMSSYQASIDAMKGLSNAILSTTMVFMVVFIPVSFMGGTSGTFYTQFGLTMAVAVGISMINALTLSPALCALLLRPHLDEFGAEHDNFSARFRRAFNVGFDAVLGRYIKAAILIVRHKWLPWLMLVCSCALLVYLMGTTKTSLVPDEDQGIVFVNVSAAPGSSLNATDKIMQDVERRISQIPEIQETMSVAGYGLIGGEGSSYGFIIAKLRPWDVRTEEGQDVNSVIGKIYGMTAGIKDAMIFSMSPGMIPGYGLGNSVEMHVQDRMGGSVNDFFNITQGFLGALNARPEIAQAFAPFDVRFPQWEVDVDAAKCMRAGISPREVLNTISGYYGSQYVSNINRFSKIYRVMIQGEPSTRISEDSLGEIFVRLNNGEMAPIDQFVTIKKVYGAASLSRFNMYNSISTNTTPAPGYSTGDVINAIRETADQVLPMGYGYDYGGITREESQTTNNTAIIFAICVLMIYLILSALYESYILPLAVILSIPFGLMGSFIFAKIMGLDNNIYLQTGLIMLIGLLSKTAILITEFAVQRRKAGMSISASAIAAAKSRFRPVLMTALTMVFGLIPLMLSTGAGANGNRSLASGTVGGMIVGIFSILFVVPAIYIFFQWLQERFTPNPSTMQTDLLIDEDRNLLSPKEVDELE